MDNLFEKQVSSLFELHWNDLSSWLQRLNPTNCISIFLRIYFHPLPMQISTVLLPRHLQFFFCFFLDEPKHTVKEEESSSSCMLWQKHLSAKGQLNFERQNRLLSHNSLKAIFLNLNLLSAPNTKHQTPNLSQLVLTSAHQIKLENICSVCCYFICRMFGASRVIWHQ